MNLVVLMGHLCQAPSLRYSGNGNPICSLRLAVNGRRAKEGEQEEVLFMDVIAFGKIAEACKEHLAKGSPVLAQGRLQQRSWDKDGEQRSKVIVVADKIRFLGSKQNPAFVQEEVAETKTLDHGQDEIPF